MPRALFDQIEHLTRRREADDGYTVHPGSVLFAANAASTPYEVGHGVHRHLDIAIDHLMAIKLLAVDAGTIPTYGAFTLLRAAVENFASAMWLLRGEDTKERVLRELQFQAANLKALTIAEALAAAAQQRSATDVDGRLDLIRQVAGRNGLTMRAVERRADWRRIVQSLGFGAGTEATAEFLWKTCSAFAHGDPWPSRTFLDHEELPTSTDTVVELRVTASLPSLTPMLQLALSMADLVLRTFDAMRVPARDSAATR
ncbi:hypothetical protein Ais01nite_21790 [Asanoa ishikariensis]|uniref:Uncharacterized protein n=2 Tax=Asanoa ishikariensis TaxID=137265 RepID=A0A1H3U7Q5_9ACTN|nr:hypothetical protein Ais01nite_21790 [Asanoa ishikariensis]SDZ58327.1 hypothetical protein SAMN05421684_6695 [Asanoa ishikariensis]